MYLSRTLTALAGLTLGVTGLTACASSDASTEADDTLTFAAIPSEQSTSVDLEFENVISLLEEETGKSVEVIKATDYNAVIEGMLAGDVDLASFGPLSYVLAKNNGADISPVATVATEKGGAPTYQSYGVVPADSDIASLEDYRDKTVCFVDPASTSGYLFPTTALVETGIDPQQDLEPVMAGGHDSSALSVRDGDCDAGFAYDGQIDELLAKGDLERGDLKVVWKSEPIPESPVAIQNSLPTELKEQIESVFVEQANVDAMVESGTCESAANCEVTADSDYWGYVAVDDAAYEPVRTVCEVTKNEECTGS